MRKEYKSWLIYSLGIFVVCAIIFLVRLQLKSSFSEKDLALVFCGYFIGWLEHLPMLIIQIILYHYEEELPTLHRGKLSNKRY